jgi:diketogulonate reductase-like aldo/keto reductase
VRQLESLVAGARIPPACNQVESHPYLTQEAMLATCTRLGVTMTAYSPLGSAGTGGAAALDVAGLTVVRNPTLTQIGERLGKSAAQVATSFLPTATPNVVHAVIHASILTVIHTVILSSCTQVAISFQTSRGVPTFPKSVNAVRVAENLDVVALDASDLEQVRALDRGWAGRAGYGGPKVERDGVLEPRDVRHPDYPFQADGSEKGGE